MMQNISNTLAQATSTLQGFAIGVAVIMIVIAGYQLFLGGDQGVQKGKKILIWTAVGLVLIFGANAIAQWWRGSITF